MSPTVQQIDTTVAPEATLAALHDLYLQIDREVYPGDHDLPWEQRLVDWRNIAEQHVVPRWFIEESGVIVATAGCFHHKDRDLENTYAWAYVLPHHRGRGLFRQLAGAVLDFVEADGRIRIATSLRAGGGLEPLAKRAGLKPAYNERISQLAIDEVDMSLMDSWIEKAAERAEGYDLMFLPSPIPEEHIDRYVDVMEVMNTAPLEDFDEEPTSWTPEMWRDVERAEIAKDKVFYTLVARHLESDKFVGYTQIVYQQLHRVKAHQWDTGVDPAHRNKGLGRWLKATMLRRLLQDHPEIEVIETENAESNDPMLNINIAMGFKPAHEMVIWQGPTAKVREALL